MLHLEKKKLHSGCSCGSCTDSCENNEKHSHEHDEEHEHDEPITKLQIVLFSISIVLFAVGFIPMPQIAKAIVYGIAILFAGYDLFISGFKHLFKFELEETVLLLVAMVASFILGEYMEAAIVTILFKLGNFLEAYAIGKSKKNMEKLTEIRPDVATISDGNGGYKKVDAKSINVGDIIYLKAGDRVALDCSIIEGNSDLDNSALTGESVPIAVKSGDTILSGSINLNGFLKCKVEKSFENSTASQIIDLIYASSQKKSKAQAYISKIARVYTPVMMCLALLVGVVPPLFGAGTFRQYIMNSLIFLVASCPCSLVISIPLTFFSVVGAESKIGVLVKGSMYIESLSKVQVVCLDKTGTVTSGKLFVDEIITVDKNYDEKKILSIAKSLEKNSAHPIAQAIISAGNDLGEISFDSTNEKAGFGITGIIGEDNYTCGGINMLKELNIFDSNTPIANVYILKGNAIIGYIILKEEIDEENKKLVSELKKVGIEEVIMLTGDNEKSAKKVADECKLDKFYSSLLPIDKVKKIEEVKASGKRTLFAGDGINDAPVLAAADVSVSMGFGSEIANASSDIILASNKLSILPNAISIAKRGMRVIFANITFALVIKAIVLTLGAIGLAQMWMAVFADIGVTILTILNAIRLLKIKK